MVVMMVMFTVDIVLRDNLLGFRQTYSIIMQRLHINIEVNLHYFRRLFQF